MASFKVVSGPPKGPLERGHIKNCQKVSRQMSTSFDSLAQEKNLKNHQELEGKELGP